MPYKRISKLSLDEQNVILAQQINRAGIKRLRRMGLPVPAEAHVIERARQLRRFGQVTSRRLLDDEQEEA